MADGGPPPLIPNPPTLKSDSRLRIATFTLLSFTGGLHSGLFNIGIGPWLLGNGTTTEGLGALMAVVTLPGSLKLLVAPIVDTCICRRYGLRRPWVIVGTIGLLSASLAMAGAHDLPSISALGFLVYSFGMLKDVAQDAMAISLLLPEERAQLNALMVLGWTAGDSLMGGLSGWLLPNVGLVGVAPLMALLTVPGALLVICVLEKPGERLLPASKCATATALQGTGSTGAGLATRIAVMEIRQTQQMGR